MTGLLFHKLVKATASINLLYIIYVLISLFLGDFPFTLLWQKVALLIFIINMSIHARLGMWSVVTDYIPYRFQNILLRCIEIYLFLIVIWVIILVCL